MINNITIIDDDEIALFITKKTLELGGVAKNLNCFLSAKEALNFLKKNANQPSVLPEIILLDLNMPEMDGWSFIKEYNCLRNKLLKNCNIIIHSSSLHHTDIQRANTDKDVSGYLAKPLDLTGLKKWI